MPRSGETKEPAAGGIGTVLSFTLAFSGVVVSARFAAVTPAPTPARPRLAMTLCLAISRRCSHVMLGSSMKALTCSPAVSAATPPAKAAPRCISLRPPVIASRPAPTENTVPASSAGSAASLINCSLPGKLRPSALCVWMSRRAACTLSCPGVRSTALRSASQLCGLRVSR